MASRYETELIVEAISKGFDKVAADIQSAGQATDKSGDAAKQSSMKWTELQSALGLVKQGYEMVKGIAVQTYQELSEGANLELTAQKFDKLAASIGTTGEALENSLNREIGQLMSNSEKMGLATDLMSLGLAKTKDEAIQLTSVAGKLGMDMNQLVLTLTNQTTMRFDSLGVAVDGFDEKVKNLEKTGMSADEAFKWAFIEQANDQIAKTGDISETTAGKLKILESSIKDAQDAYKMGVAEGMAGDLEFLATNVEITTEAYRKMGELKGGVAGFLVRETFGQQAALDALNNSLRLGIITQQEYNRAMVTWNMNMGNVGQTMDFVNQKTAEWNAKQDEAIDGMSEQIAAAESADQAMLAYAANMYAAGVATQNLSANALKTAGDVNYLLGVMSGLDAGSSATTRKAQRIHGATAFAAKGDLYGNTAFNPSVLDSTRAKLAEIRAETEGISTGAGGIATGFSEAEQAVLDLNAATGSLFSQAMGMEEFDPNAYLFKQLEQQGASAQVLAQYGVDLGQFDQGESEDYLKRAAQMAELERVAAGIVTGDTEYGNIAGVVEGIGETLGENITLAEEFFTTLSEEPVETAINLDTTGAQTQMDDFKLANANMNIKVNLVTSDSGGSEIQDAMQETGDRP